jgi:CRISPR system Cascade subunit CasA
MSRFNLLDEKWIPVRFPDGTRDELGIRDVLMRSSEIAIIEDPSPLVVAGLHRLLLAVLYRALEGPTDIDQAKALFQDGLPGERITAYLEKWQGRFWLFDEKYPFYQVPDYEPKDEKGQRQWKPWTVLAAEHNGDNSKVLFDHVDNTNAGDIPTGKAARWLVACQTFALGGGNSDFQYTKTGVPSATAAIALPLGRSLQDTLTLSLVPENVDVMESDLPVWERGADAIASLRRGVERPARGWVDLYSWQSRSVKLRLQDDGRTLDGLAFASGVVCEAGGMVDPMLSYRIDEERGRLPVQFHDRGLWRDFDSLLPDESRLGPRVLDHAVALTRTRPDRFPHSVMVVGQANDKRNAAKVKYWRMERFVFPGALAGDRHIRAEIRQLLVDAEGADRQLWSACSSFARNLLGRGDRKPAERDIKEFVRQLSASSWYWSALEARFQGVLGEITLDRDSEEVRRTWLVAVQDTLSEAWERHRTSVATGDAWTIRAIVKAERSVLRKLKQLDEEIRNLSPQMEDA